MDDTKQQLPRIGGKNVAAAGVLLLAPDDVEASIGVRDLTYTVVFAHSDQEPTLSFDTLDRKHLKITISGTLEGKLGGVAWDVGQIGSWGEQKLSLVLHVSSVGSPQSIRAITYTFTISGGGA